MRLTPVALAALALTILVAPHGAAQPPSEDAAAHAVAERVMAAVGGRDGWAAARHVTWRFFGGRHWAWDKWTGRARVDAGELVVLFDVNTRQGRAWRDGQSLQGGELADALTQAHAWFINDSYWMFMPFKLRDPGVHLSHRGTAHVPTVGETDVLRLTFDEVGLTPQNAYDVFVDRRSGLVVQWSFYAKASDVEPRFTLPWTDWRWFGPIRLATDHGRHAEWDIAVLADLPDSVYADPAPWSRSELRRHSMRVGRR